MTTPHPPASLLPPSPLQLTQALKAAVDIVRRRLGLFAGLALLPGVLAAIVFLVVTLGLAVAFFRPAGRGQFDAAPVLVAILGMIVAFLAILAIQIKANGMITLLAHETAHGRAPDLDALMSGTRGIVGRTIVLLLVAAAAGAVLTGVLIAIMGAVFWGAASSRNPESALGFVLLFPLFGLALGIASIYLSTRWLYYNQALAIEGRDGFGALGSSWRLTRNDFWRTLGWYLAAAAIAFVAVWIVTLFFGAIGDALGTGRSNLATGANVLTSIVFLVTTTAMEVLIAPALIAFTTVMYIDRQRRLQPGPAAGVWPPPQFGPSPYGPPPQYGTGPYQQPPCGQPQQPPYGQPQQPPYGPPQP